MTTAPRHQVTVFATWRQVGRSRITDFFWRCSCGATTAAPRGFSTRNEARIDGAAHEQDNNELGVGITMANSRAYLTKAADALASAVSDTQAWPGDLDESAPAWADVMKQLGEIAGRVMQGAVLVRDAAEEAQPPYGGELGAVSSTLVGALDTATYSRVVVDRKWSNVANGFAREVRNTLPKSTRAGRQPVRVLSVAEPVSEAARAVRTAAAARLAPGEIGAVLNATVSVSEAMCGLVTRIAVALARRDEEYPPLTGISRVLRRGIHSGYREMGEHFDTAAEAHKKITTRWPGRWPNRPM